MGFSSVFFFLPARLFPVFSPFPHFLCFSPFFRGFGKTHRKKLPYSAKLTIAKIGKIWYYRFNAK